MNLLQCQAAQYVAVSLGKETFKILLNRIVGGYPSRAALAKALEITPSRLSRALNTGDFPFNIKNCLRLALVTGESPTTILRAANKAAIAELIESLYGQDRTTLLSAAERNLLELWNNLTPPQRENWLVLLGESVAAAIRQPGVPKPRTIRVRPTGFASKQNGRALADPAGTDADLDPISGVPREEIRRMATELLSISGEAQQAGHVDKPAHRARAAGKHAAARSIAPTRPGAPARKRGR